MPTLTRRRNPDAPQETWHVYYGDVRVGAIAIRSGNPADTDPWGWRCCFYPGSRPGECKNGTAASYEAVRSGFLAAWRVFLSHRTDEHCDHAGHDQDPHGVPNESVDHEPFLQ